MIGLIQRVKHASVVVDNQCIGAIQQGLLILLGVERSDDSASAKRLAERILRYRVFCDGHGKMNLSVQQIAGSVLIVPQFTLVADTSRGNRPSFSNGAQPEQGKRLYQAFIAAVAACDVVYATGVFGAEMEVNLLNDGPATFVLTT